MKNRLIQRSPEILSGTPVFAGTRVPVQTLNDYLEAGDRLDEFLDDFPTVSREQAIAIFAESTKMANQKTMAQLQGYWDELRLVHGGIKIARAVNPAH